MGKNKRTPKSQRTPDEQTAASINLSVDPNTTQPSRSSLPATKDRPPRGSVGYGLDESVFAKNPLANIDSTEESKSLPSGHSEEKHSSKESASSKSKMEQKDKSQPGATPYPGHFEHDQGGPIYSEAGGISAADGRHLPPDVHPRRGNNQRKLDKNGDSEISPETEELAHDQLQPGDIGVNIGKDGYVSPGSKRKGKASEVKGKGAQASPETSELQPVSLEKGEFGYNPGKGDDRDRQKSGKHLETKKRTPETSSAEGTSETAELRQLSLGKGEFGYNPGKTEELGEDSGENPEASQVRRRLSQSVPHHGIPKNSASQKQTPGNETSPETEELQQVSMNRGEMGYNIGNEPPSGHSKKKHPDTSAETQELRSNHLHREDIGPQHLKLNAETRELRHIDLGKGEIGYNPGKGDDRDRREPGEHPAVKKHDRPAGTSSQPKQQTSGKSGSDSAIEELGYINVGRDDFGYNVGRGNEPGEETGENPAASKARERLSQSQPNHSIKSTQTPETRELGSIHLSQRDIGPQTTQASQETRELRHIQLRKGEFGYNVGRGEESGHIRADEDSTENPGAARARRRASMQSNSDGGEERPNFGYRNLQRARRPSGELGIEPQIHGRSCSPHISSPFRDSPPHCRGDVQANDTLQSYLQAFLAERGSNATGTLSDSPLIHSSQAMEGASHRPMSSHDRELIESEHRFQKRVPTETQIQQKSTSSSSGGTSITLEQLQLVLGQFKRDILDSIDSHNSHYSNDEKHLFSGKISQLGPRLGRIETDIDFIRKQINVPASANGILPQELADSTPNGDILARSTNANNYRRSGDKKVNWRMISLGVMAALSLVALGGMLGSARHSERGWGGKLAEWLFKEGRGQKAGK